MLYGQFGLVGACTQTASLTAQILERSRSQASIGLPLSAGWWHNRPCAAVSSEMLGIPLAEHHASDLKAGSERTSAWYLRAFVNMKDQPFLLFLPP